jgi:hypothetical protein
MDSERFDRLVQRFGQTRSRRQTLRGLAGALAVGALALGGQEADAGKANGGTSCTRGRQCKTGKCVGDPDQKVCSCSKRYSKCSALDTTCQDGTCQSDECTGLGCTCPPGTTYCDLVNVEPTSCNGGSCFCAERSDGQGTVCFSPEAGEGGALCEPNATGANVPICQSDADCEALPNSSTNRCVKAGTCEGSNPACVGTACVKACVA